MRRALVVTTIVAGLVFGLIEPTRAQSRPGTPVGATVTWTAIGAGSGFGIGIWVGLTAFDDAINSDRKVWTTAVIGGVAGGVAGYLVGRARDRRAAIRRQPSTVGLPSSAIGHQWSVATPQWTAPGEAWRWTHARSTTSAEGTAPTTRAPAP